MKSSHVFMILLGLFAFLLFFGSQDNKGNNNESYGVKQLVIESRETPAINQSENRIGGVIIGLVLSAIVFIVVLFLAFGGELLKQIRLLKKRGKNGRNSSNNNSFSSRL